MFKRILAEIYTRFVTIHVHFENNVQITSTFGKASGAYHQDQQIMGSWLIYWKKICRKRSENQWIKKSCFLNLYLCNIRFIFFLIEKSLNYDFFKFWLMILTYLGFNFDRERESKFQGTSRKSQMCLFTISWVCNSIGRNNLIDKSCFLFYSNDTKPLALVSPYGSSEEQVSDKRGFT